MIHYQVGLGLHILFVGVNPSPGSYKRGIPFSSNKMFWYLLHDAGLVDEPRSVLQDDVQLKKIYMDHLKKKYKFGFVNMVDRPTQKASEVKRDEATPGRERLYSFIKQYRPLVVCFVGKITYSLFIESTEFNFGWQPDIFSSKIYVMRSPNHGLASVRIQDLENISKALKESRRLKNSN
ncbi:mismatch-specific DNA-glycosylase [Candidatus Dependentiae bacterium]|nr:mismatch-specific DNA-glycosylase [Candidatus Dependentiae bacterium]